MNQLPDSGSSACNWGHRVHPSCTRDVHVSLGREFKNLLWVERKMETWDESGGNRFWLYYKEVAYLT